METSGTGVDTSVPVVSSSSALIISGGGGAGALAWLASGSTSGSTSMA